MGTNTSGLTPTTGSKEIKADLYSMVGTYQPEINTDTTTGEIKPLVVTHLVLSSKGNVKVEVNLKEIDRRNKNMQANRR
jgi:hypothetical protein